MFLTLLITLSQVEIGIINKTSEKAEKPLEILIGGKQKPRLIKEPKYSFSLSYENTIEAMLNVIIRTPCILVS